MFRSIMFASLALTTALLRADDPVKLYQGLGAQAPKQPQACVSSKGVVHLTFGVGNKVFYCGNSGGTFELPVAAFEVPNLSLGMRRGPRIAATSRSVVITAIGGAEGKGKDGDLLAYRSDDEGRTWLGPVRVNDADASAREGLHAMTVTDNGVLWCVWLDLRSNMTELYASRSEDDGRSWSKNLLVYRSPDGSVCECCHPSIATVGDSIHVLFRNSLAGNRDMYLVSSNDNGRTFGRAQRLGLQSWQLNGCPMDGGMLAVTPSGAVVSVWRREGKIFTTDQETSVESSLGSGEQPWIASNAEATYVVWTSSREGDLMFSKLGSSEPAKLAGSAHDPIVVAANRRSTIAHLFWEQRGEEKTSIMWQTTR